MNREILDYRGKITAIRKDIAQLSVELTDKQEIRKIKELRIAQLREAIDSAKSQKDTTEDIKVMEASIQEIKTSMESIQSDISRDKEALSSLQAKHKELVLILSDLELSDVVNEAQTKAAWQREANAKRVEAEYRTAAGSAAIRKDRTEQGTAGVWQSVGSGVGGMVNSAFQGVVGTLSAFDKYEAAINARYRNAMQIGTLIDRNIEIEKLTEKYLSGKKSPAVNDELAALRKSLIEQGIVSADEEDADSVSEQSKEEMDTASEEGKTKGDSDSEKADTKKADTKKADTRKADTKKTDTMKADTEKADTKKADTKKVDTKKTDTEKADTKKADSKKADIGKAGKKTSDNKESGAEKATSTKATSTKAATKTGASKAASTKAASTKAAATKTGASKTASTKTAATKTGASKTASTKAASTKAATTKTATKKKAAE